MALTSNEVTYKGVTQPIEICNRCRWQFTEPDPCCFLEGGRNVLQITSSGVCWSLRIVLNAPM